MPSRYYPLILIVFSFVIFILGTGDLPLTDPDETFYAQTAKEMLEAGEYVTPLLLGEPQFEKPPFTYWLIMTSYGIFGVNEFAARFPSVLFGILGVVGVYFLGRVIFSPLCGLLSGIVMATSVEYLVLAKAVVTDMVLAVSILYSLIFFLMYTVKGKGYYFYLSAFSSAIAVMTKGPIGVLIPGMIIVPYLIFSREFRKMNVWHLVCGFFIFLAVSMPWYVMVTRVHGASFLDAFFGFHNVTRFLVPEHRIGSSPFFYFPVLIGGFFPWILLVPYAIRVMATEDKHVSIVKGHKLLLILWVVSILAFFSVSRTKLVTYIFPLFPAMCIITGRLWEIKKRTWYSYVPAALITVLVFFLHAGLPDIMSEASSKTLAMKLREVDVAKGALGGEDDHRWGIAFYSGRKDVKNIHPYNDMVKFFQRPDPVWGIIRDKHFDQINKQLPGLRLETVARNGKYVLVTNKPFEVDS